MSDIKIGENREDSEWAANKWIADFCDLGGLVLPEAREFKWSESVTDFENFPTKMKTLKAMSRVMVELDSAPDRRDQVFAALGA